MGCKRCLKPRARSFLLLALIGISASAEGQVFQVTTGNAVDLGVSGAEPTVAAIGPGQSQHCPKGRLFFASGNTVLATDLNGLAVTWANPTESPNPRTFQYSETVNPYPILDNHLVKLKDNSLVHTVEAITWNENVRPRPAWWNLTKEFPMKREYLPGGRPGAARSSMSIVRWTAAEPGPAPWTSTRRSWRWPTQTVCPRKASAEPRGSRGSSRRSP